MTKTENKGISGRSMRSATNEFRVTRPELYDTGELRDRQGHYVRAETERDAVAIMAARYDDAVFDVQVWRRHDELVGAELGATYTRNGMRLHTAVKTDG